MIVANFYSIAERLASVIHAKTIRLRGVDFTNLFLVFLLLLFAVFLFSVGRRWLQLAPAVSSTCVGCRFQLLIH